MGGIGETIVEIPNVPTIRQIKRAGLNIAVYVPLPKAGVVPEAFIHLWDIARRGYEHPPFVGGRTDANRNKVGQWMLQDAQKKFTHVVMLDADHLHREDIVERMARWVMQDRSRLVIGALNFRRTPPHDACLFQPDDEGKLHSMTTWRRGLVRTPLMGHGSLLVAREVFEQLEAPWWAYSYNYAAKGNYPAEDSYFCYNCVRHEIDLWCDTTITSPHLGTMFIDERVFHAYRAQMKQEAQANEG